MFRFVSLASSLILGGAIATAVVPGAEPPARAQVPAPPGMCPEKLGAGQANLLCYCPAEAVATGGVRGSDVYTDDSAICRAALHAGAVGLRGGIVSVRREAGQDSYPAINRNSVASSASGRWGRSIAFDNARSSGPEAIIEAGSCPANAAGLVLGTRLRCGCSAAAARSGDTIWGSGPYTADSSICRAARHAGIIGAGGGQVFLNIGEGRGAYRSSTRNGVQSFVWGNYDTSIVFSR